MRCANNTLQELFFTAQAQNSNKTLATYCTTEKDTSTFFCSACASIVRCCFPLKKKRKFSFLCFCFVFNSIKQDQRSLMMNQPPNHNYYYNMPQQQQQQQQPPPPPPQNNWHTETAVRYNVHGHYDMAPPYRHTSISYASRSEIAPISQHDGGQYETNEVSQSIVLFCFFFFQKFAFYFSILRKQKRIIKTMSIYKTFYN